MNLLEALHNFATHLINRSPQDQLHEAIDLLHAAMVMTGHATAAAKLDDAVATAQVIVPAIDAAVNPAPVVTPVSSPVAGAAVVSPPGA